MHCVKRIKCHGLTDEVTLSASSFLLTSSELGGDVSETEPSSTRKWCTLHKRERTS